MDQHRNLMLSLFIGSGLLLLLGLLGASPGAGETPADHHPIHLNLKVDGRLSPAGQPTPDHPPAASRASSHWSNDDDESRYKGNWTTLGSWTAAPVRFDLELTGASFEVWWVEDPDDKNFDARLELRWLLQVDGMTVLNLTTGALDEDDDGYADGIGLCDQTREEPCHYLTNGTLDNLSLLKGQRLGLELSMRAFQTIYLLFDAQGRESGMDLTTNATRLYARPTTTETAGFEYVEAWPTNATAALVGDFITLFGGQEQVINGQQPSKYPLVEAGDRHAVNGALVRATRITWFYQGQDPRVEFSYTAHDSVNAHVRTLVLPELEGARNINENGRQHQGSSWSLWGGVLLLLIIVVAMWMMHRYDER